jgi:hypothetical protein
MPKGASGFALFVSSVVGLPVTRWGSRTLIGASRSAATPTVVDYDTDAVVAIPDDEYRKYSREYDRALGNGSLRRRTEKDWQAQNRQPEKRATERGAGTPSAPAVDETPAQE